MPYHVGKSSSCPTSKPWTVLKDDGSKAGGCHPSKAKANEQMKAMYANEPSAKNSPSMATRVVVVPNVRPATNMQRTANVSRKSETR
jgi:hypothetical protein